MTIKDLLKFNRIEKGYIHGTYFYYKEHDWSYIFLTKEIFRIRIDNELLIYKNIEDMLNDN